MSVCFYLARAAVASDLIDSNSVLPDFKASRISDDPLSALGDFCRILKSGDLSAERISATKKPAGFSFKSAGSCIIHILFFISCLIFYHLPLYTTKSNTLYDMF